MAAFKEMANTSRSLRRSETPKRLETRKVLLNSGENCVQWNLAAIVERCRLRVFLFELFADVVVSNGEGSLFATFWSNVKKLKSAQGVVQPTIYGIPKKPCLINLLGVTLDGIVYAPFFLIQQGKSGSRKK